MEESKEPENIVVKYQSDEDSDTSDDTSEGTSDDTSDEELNKLETEIDTNILLHYHPETKSINYKELNIRSNNKNKYSNIKAKIDDPLHQTLPILTKFEKSKIIGMRAKQLANGAEPLIAAKNLIDNLKIAELELKEKKLPFIIARPLPNNTVEYWKLEDLEMIH